VALLAEADALFQKSKFVAALTLAEKALRAGGGARALVVIGKINLETDDLTAAAAAYEEALRLAPGDEAAQRGLARARGALRNAPKP
jgi:cytochrome c-type biogenesis protein CcmH/NrfG